MSDGSGTGYRELFGGRHTGQFRLLEVGMFMTLTCAMFGCIFIWLGWDHPGLRVTLGCALVYLFVAFWIILRFSVWFAASNFEFAIIVSFLGTAWTMGMAVVFEDRFQDAIRASFGDGSETLGWATLAFVVSLGCLELFAFGPAFLILLIVKAIRSTRGGPAPRPNNGRSRWDKPVPH